MKITVLSAKRIMSPDLARAGKVDMWVTYRTDTDTVDTVTLPAETYTEQALVLAVRQHEEKKGQLIGKVLET